MTSDRPADYLASLLHELCALPRETEWLEFKVNDAEPQALGEYISALANSAALAGKAFGYLVWGVRDEDHAVVGTTFDPRAARVGSEELESWLLRLLEPKIDFRFFTVEVDGGKAVILEIARAARHPVRFSGQEFIRIGTYKKKLKDFPEKERALWRIFDRMPFEDGVAFERASGDDVLRSLDYPPYFDLIERPLPANRDGILAALADDRLIRRCDAGGWDVTNLGAILFAKRIEVTNPGEPLVDTQRFIDTPPRSRNEGLASLMRRFRICEERGSGIDKVVAQVELFQLPAPLFENPEGFTRAVLFAHKSLSDMDRSDRIRACYLHACLRYVMRQPMTNASLRERFGIGEKNASMASRFLNEAVEAGLIVVADPAVGTRIRSYLPFWASPIRRSEEIA